MLLLAFVTEIFLYCRRSKNEVCIHERYSFIFYIYLFYSFIYFYIYLFLPFFDTQLPVLFDEY